MKILLHGCCADCTLKFLVGTKEEVAVYFYNPNIHPRSEYLARLKAMQKVCLEKAVKLIVADWSPREYFEEVKTPLNRCSKCWQLRLEKSAKYAADKGYTHLATTLMTSQYQDGETVRKIGMEASKRAGVRFYEPDEIECELKTSGFYKQNYCGCGYSLIERMEEKYGLEDETIEK